MRLLILSVAGVLVAAGAAPARAQSSGSSSDVTQLPVGQIYKDFQYPYWEVDKSGKGPAQLKYTLSAARAKGITINRAETTNLKIDLYTDGKVTTTITSPDADVYMAERMMRTHNTVKIVRADLVATSQFCNFDLLAKQYTLRDHVKVVLLHFDMNTAAPGSAPGAKGAATSAAGSATPPKPTPAIPSSAGKDDSLLQSPGSYSTTNNAPLPR